MDHDKQEQRNQWDRVAAGWKRWWPTIERGAQAVSTRLLELADVGPGMRVLDIATGIGEPALTAARRVGVAGRVVATDLSPRMLEIANERAFAAGLTNVAFLQADAEWLDLPDASFDAVLWRWGPTDLSDPSNALVSIRRMLKTDRCFAAAAWESDATSRPLAHIAATVADEVFGAATPPTTTSPPTTSLDRELIRAGFHDVAVERMTLTLTFGSVDDCVQYLRDVSPLFAERLSDRSARELEVFRDALAQKLRPHLGDDGEVGISNTTLCVWGRSRAATPPK